MTQMTQEEQDARNQRLQQKLDELDAEERESRKRKIKWFVIIAAVICVVIAIGMHYKKKSGEKAPDVYYLEDGRTIDYNRMRSKIMSDGNYDNVSAFKNDYAIVEKNGKMGIVNGHGKLIVPVEYDYVDYFDMFYPDMAKIMVGDKIGLVNKQGKIVVKPVYDEIESFTNGLAPATRNGKKVYIDMEGHEKEYK